MQHMISLFLRVGQTNRIFLWFYLRIGMPYIPRGLQFNWSEHRPVKAEAAGSSPVSPELGFNEWRNSYFLFSWKKGEGARSNTHSHRAPLLRFFILHLSLKKEGRRIGIFFSLLPIDKERHTYDIEYRYFTGIHT